jgi:hypothetical protein
MARSAWYNNYFHIFLSHSTNIPAGPPTTSGRLLFQKNFQGEQKVMNNSFLNTKCVALRYNIAAFNLEKMSNVTQHACNFIIF